MMAFMGLYLQPMVIAGYFIIKGLRICIQLCMNKIVGALCLMLLEVINLHSFLIEFRPVWKQKFSFF